MIKLLLGFIILFGGFYGCYIVGKNSVWGNAKLDAQEMCLAAMIGFMVIISTLGIFGVCYGIGNAILHLTL